MERAPPEYEGIELHTPWPTVATLLGPSKILFRNSDRPEEQIDQNKNSTADPFRN